MSGAYADEHEEGGGDGHGHGCDRYEAASPRGPPSSLDLLYWSDQARPTNGVHCPRRSATNDSSAFMNASDERPPMPPRSVVRTNQPAGGVSTISFGADLSLEEPDPLFQRRRPSSDSKRREMTGSRIFHYDPELKLPAASHPVAKTLVADGAIPCFEDKPPTPKMLDVEKQHYDLGEGNMSGSWRSCSSAKTKELEGSNIFGRSHQYDNISQMSWNHQNDITIAEQQENKAPRTGAKNSNAAGQYNQNSFNGDGGSEYGIHSKGHFNNQKALELSGNNIFENNNSAEYGHNNNNSKDERKNNGHYNSGNYERNVSAAKRREMIGNDIFSTANSHNYEMEKNVRQPPGGNSNLKLI